MQSTSESASASKGALWAGRVVSALVVAFMIFDGVTKVVKAQQVVEATVRIGFPESTVFGIGAVLLVCTALHVIPKTSVLGAILLTGYLGGATAANVRAGSAVFNTIFPIIFSVLVWVGLFLREGRLRALIPFRTLNAGGLARRFAPLRAYHAVHFPDQPCIPRGRFFPFSRPPGIYSDTHSALGLHCSCMRSISSPFSGFSSALG